MKEKIKKTKKTELPIPADNSPTRSSADDQIGFDLNPGFLTRIDALETKVDKMTHMLTVVEKMLLEQDTHLNRLKIEQEQIRRQMSKSYGRV